MNITENNDRNLEVGDALDLAVTYYHSHLPGHVRERLHQFGLMDATIDKYMIGYADGSLAAAAVETDPSREMLVRLMEKGLARVDAHGVPRDCFTDQITIPVVVDGEVVGIVGVRMDSTEPRYQATRGIKSPVFIPEPLHQGDVVVVMDPLDALVLGQAEIRAIALAGNVCQEHLAGLLPPQGRIVVCVGADAAEQRNIEPLIALFPHRAKVMEVPGGMAPGEFIRQNGIDRFRALIGEAVDGLAYIVGQIPRGTPETEIFAKVRPIIPAFAGMDEPTREAFYTDLFNKMLHMSAEWMRGLREEVRKHRRTDGATLNGFSGECAYATNGHGIIDVVDEDGHPRFLVYDEHGDLVVAQTILVNGVTYVPPPVDQIPFKLPRTDAVLYEYNRAIVHGAEADSFLLDDIREFLAQLVELPNQSLYLIVALWAMLSHLADKFEFCPILALLGEPERGKTRLGKAVIGISRRGFMTETLNPGYIPRFSSAFAGSLFLDVVDVSGKALNRGSRDILNARYSRDTLVPRVTRPSKGIFGSVDYFPTYGPTVIASNLPLDDIFKTRTLTITMGVSSRRFETEVTADYCLPMLAKLVAFRARHFNTVPPACSKPVDGRLGDLLRALKRILLLIAPHEQEEFLRGVEYFVDNRAEDRSCSLGARVLKAIAAAERRNRRILVKDIALHAFADRSIDNCRAVGTVARSMGFTTKRGNDGFVVLYDEDRLKEMAAQYGLADDQPEAPGEDGEHGEHEPQPLAG